ncbi:F-box only protein 16 [Nematolebias whitei]|uniref:F-box only protein 16 n=1 Tax=Nematolebias whitei TaxID=451745 RepID=UPI001899DAAB|nr:F-box only protein 16 [Nematolebias whitei]
MPLTKRPSNNAKLETNRSAWTPLNHPLNNSQVFEERRQLIAKWFLRWSDSQRKAVLHDSVLSCAVEQLRFLSVSVSRRLPLQAADFSCLLPRVLCLYIFSFLDPRSLCRCAQVSWHWKSIVELDQLWMPKCLRLGWCVSSSPSPFEQGVWKRLYIQSVQELQIHLQQVSRAICFLFLLIQPPLKVPEGPAVSSDHAEPQRSVHINEERPASATQPPRTRSGSRLKKEKPVNAPPPWRGSDKHPKDTVRFNYLENLDPIQQALTAQTSGRAPTCSSTAELNGGRKKPLSEASYKLRKAKSLMLLTSSCRVQQPPAPPDPPHQTQTHPSLTSQTPEAPTLTKGTAISLLGLAQWNAGIRPRPVRPPLPRLSSEGLRASQRSHRSAPSKSVHLLCCFELI